MTSFFGHMIFFFKTILNFLENVSQVDRVKGMFCSLYNNQKTPLFNKVAQQVGENQPKMTTVNFRRCCFDISTPEKYTVGNGNKGEVLSIT